METVKYILLCIAGCLDSLVGKNAGLSWDEFICGELSILAIIIMIFSSFFLLEKTTRNNYKINFLLSILITVILVVFVFFLLIAFNA